MNIRIAKISDVTAACQLLNEIIEIGGTTAFQQILSEAEFKSCFINDDNCIKCLVCEGGEGSILGFQALSVSTKLPEDWLDIATFARVNPKTKGVGTLLFEQTRIDARMTGARTINATIRADNNPGLSYYTKMGFVDYRIDKSVPLRDGTLVDRISKRYELS